MNESSFFPPHDVPIGIKRTDDEASIRTHTTVACINRSLGHYTVNGGKRDVEGGV